MPASFCPPKVAVSVWHRWKNIFGKTLFEEALVTSGHSWLDFDTLAYDALDTAALAGKRWKKHAFKVPHVSKWRAHASRNHLIHTYYMHIHIDTVNRHRVIRAQCLLVRQWFNQAFKLRTNVQRCAAKSMRSSDLFLCGRASWAKDSGQHMYSGYAVYTIDLWPQTYSHLPCSTRVARNRTPESN